MYPIFLAIILVRNSKQNVGIKMIILSFNLKVIKFITSPVNDKIPLISYKIL